jgi:hypothetical protein
MEPSSHTIVYTIHTKVYKVHNNSRGWWVHFYGSHESLYLGNDKPDLDVGDEITIRIFKYAKSS